MIESELQTGPIPSSDHSNSKLLKIIINSLLLPDPNYPPYSHPTISFAKESQAMDGSDDDSAMFSMFSKRVKSAVPKVTETKEITLQAEKHAVKDVEDRLTFSDLGLNDWVVKCCNSMGIVKPTPVQVWTCCTCLALEVLHSGSVERQERDWRVSDGQW